MESLNTLGQAHADQLATLFLQRFYSSLTLADEQDLEKLANLYYTNAKISINLSPSKALNPDSQSVAKTYKDQSLSDAFFEVSAIKVTPLYAQGVLVVASGNLTKEIDSTEEKSETKNEVEQSFDHSFILLPECNAEKKTTVFYIAEERLKLGKEKKLAPKPSKKKQKPKDKPVPKAKVVPKPVQEAKEAPKPTPKAAKQPVKPAPPSKQSNPPAAAPAPAQPQKPVKPFSYASAAASAPVASSKPASVVPKPVAPKPRAAAASKPQPSAKPARQILANSLCVKRVPAEVTEEVLTEAFKAFGSVKSVDLKKESKIAFVEFTSSDPVESLLSKPVKERVVVVKAGDKDVSLDLWRKESREGASRGRGRGRGAKQQ